MPAIHFHFFSLVINFFSLLNSWESNIFLRFQSYNPHIKKSSYKYSPSNTLRNFPLESNPRISSLFSKNLLHHSLSSSSWSFKKRILYSNLLNSKLSSGYTFIPLFLIWSKFFFSIKPRFSFTKKLVIVESVYLNFSEI